MDKRAIGVFDSGLGGLTVVKELQRQLPNEDIVYLGDTARVPYGTRSKETVVKFSLEDLKFLASKDVKCIIIACNTASSFAAKTVRIKSPVTVFDVITSGAYDATTKTITNKIGIIGTRGTINSGAYERKIKEKLKNVEIISSACPLFVPFIEEGILKGNALNEIAQVYLKKIKNKKVDTLILGCTHYPLIEPVIGKIMKNVNLINPAIGISLKVKNYLIKNKIENKKNKKGKLKVYVTDVTPTFRKTAELFLGDSLKHFELVNIE